MRSIAKGREPRSLTLHRLLPHATYANYQDKAELRNFLVQEQRGLCCYCMRRIRSDDRRTTVEHWHPQSLYPNEQLDYHNLLAACSGKTDGCLHCDASKANKNLSRNPGDSQHEVEKIIRYKPNGEVASNDTHFDAELTAVLKLNLPFFVNNRKAMLDGFTAALRRKGAVPLKRRELENLIKKWSGQGGDLDEYCQVIIYWLQKRLRRF